MADYLIMAMWRVINESKSICRLLVTLNVVKYRERMKGWCSLTLPYTIPMLL
jgi:hypothetical protein